MKINKTEQIYNTYYISLSTNPGVHLVSEEDGRRLQPEGALNVGLLVDGGKGDAEAAQPVVVGPVRHHVAVLVQVLRPHPFFSPVTSQFRF